MKKLILPLLISIITLYTPQLQAKQMECIVTVVDTMGRPIKGAEVSVWGHNFDSGLYTSVVEKLFSGTETSVEGEVCVRFELNTTENNIFVFAQKSGFAVGWSGIHTVARITEIRIVLDRINATAGIVTDEENRPIAGAKITAYPVDEVRVEGAQSHFRWPDSIFTTKTDHEGRFSFDCLAEWMKVSFAVEFPGRAYTNTSYNLEGERLRYYKAGTKDIHIMMHSAGQIKGKILAKRGNRIKGIKLIARGERIRTGKRFTSISDSDGSFIFSDLPSDVYLVTTVTAEEDSTQQLTTGAIAEVQVGQTVENVRIRMRDPIQLDVLVKDVKTDQPVENASVELSQHRPGGFATHVRYRATTDNKGIARVITLPGKCNIYLNHDDYDGSDGEYLVKSTDTNLVTGITPHSVVSGHVVYEDGRVAAGVKVRASTYETEYKLTDENGEFSLVFSESRAQKGFVIARDLKTGLAGIVDITEHEGPVKVVLTKAATLKGRVLDPDNRPIEKARVKVQYNIPYAMTNADNDLYTDENGQFELRAAPYAQKDFNYRVSVSAYDYSKIDYENIEVKKGMGEIIELPPFVLKPCNMTLSGTAVYEDGSVAAHKGVHLNNVHPMHGQSALHSVTDDEGKFRFDGACEGWLRIQCGSLAWGGSAALNDVGYIYAKGGDTVKVVMNNNYHSLQLHPTADSFEGVKLPMYEQLTKGVETETLEDKKLLVCFWYIGDEQGKKIIKELTEIADGLDSANISVILLNARPYSKKYASVNIDLDIKWLRDNKVPFAEADVPDMNDIMEIRRATGAKFLPHLILTDENRIVTDEGFDIQWLKDNVLVKEDI